jgi:hypothetical protein
MDVLLSNGQGGPYGHEPWNGWKIRDPRVNASERNVDAFGASGLNNTVKVEKGTTFTYQVSIRNDGPIPVTIKTSA